jgi:glucose-1-phosphate thymidylyltransferase
VVPKGIVLTYALPAAVWRPDVTQTPHLLPVANRPILFHALDAMRRAGIAEVGIATTDATAPAIRAALGDGRDWDLRFRYIDADPAAGAGATLLAAGDFLGASPFVAHSGDGLLGEELGPLLDSLASRPREAMLLLHGGATATERQRLENRRLLRYANGGSPERPGVSGVWCFAAGALPAAASVTASHEGPLDMSQLLARVEQGGGVVRAHTTATWRRFTGDVADLLELNRMALERLDRHEPRQFPDTVIEGKARIDPTAVIRSSVIRGPVVIGPRAEITDAYIGPYTSIAADVRIEGTEVQHSIICSGAEILHVGGPLDASIVGSGARVVRDFSLPRAFRLQVGNGVEVALC